MLRIIHAADEQRVIFVLAGDGGWWRGVEKNTHKWKQPAAETWHFDPRRQQVLLCPADCLQNTAQGCCLNIAEWLNKHHTRFANRKRWIVEVLLCIIDDIIFLHTLLLDIILNND